MHEFSDWEFTDKIMQEREDQENFEENENEYYTQSFRYISEEEAGAQWLEEEEQPAEGEEPKESQEEPKEEPKEKRKKKPGRVRRDEKETFGKGSGRHCPKGSKEERAGTRIQAAHRQKPRLEVLHRERLYLETELQDRREDLVGPTTSSISARKERAKTNLPKQEKDKESQSSRFSPETPRTQRTGKGWAS